MRLSTLHGLSHVSSPDSSAGCGWGDESLRGHPQLADSGNSRPRPEAAFMPHLGVLVSQKDHECAGAQCTRASGQTPMN